MTIATRALEYSDDDVSLTGFLAADGEQRDPRPGILLVHGGAGLDDHAREQAARYAELGYVVLACDMFGPGVAGDRERVVARLRQLRDDPQLLCRRALAGLTALRALPEVDGRAAAVGFCFGGMTVLTLARRGGDLAGVISMHGSLATTSPAEPATITAKVLACHGARDPHVPQADVTAFMDEMATGGADWQLIAYGSAMHGFTHAHAVPGAIPGVAYDAPTDRRSFAAARQFLTELFPT
ncbi:MAG: hypothetical protein V7637_5375 [Mycobacteriales bacterium]|jgi:dienelactone hydrolase